MSNLVLVLGVHRSGTSLLTAGLRALGCSLGDFCEMPDIHNPKGYAEHPAIKNFNDGFLAELGVRWDNWGFYAPAAGLDGPSLGSRRAEAVRVLQEAMPGTGPVAVKDPRVAMLLPFWTRALAEAGIHCRRILILRDPAEVAESQVRRARIAPDDTVITDAASMAALWTVTMHGLLASLPDDDTWVIGHEALISAPRETLAGCARFLGLPIDSAALDGFVRDFHDPALHRARPAAAPPAAGWPALAAALSADLRAAGLPRRLARIEAASIAEAQAGLRLMLAGLPAVRATLAKACTTPPSPPPVLREPPPSPLLPLLREALWHIGRPVLAAPADQLTALVEKMQGLAGQAPAELALNVLLARLLRALGRMDESEAVLRRLRAAAPGHPLPYEQLIEHLRRFGSIEALAVAHAEAVGRFGMRPAFGVPPARAGVTPA